MKGDAEGDSALWIRGQDELGRPIDADIVAAAKRNWTRVLTYAESRRQDGSIAAEALEYAVQSLALLNERHPRACARFPASSLAYEKDTVDTRDTADTFYFHPACRSVPPADAAP
jgi:hypothetical protein